MGRYGSSERFRGCFFGNEPKKAARIGSHQHKNASRMKFDPWNKLMIGRYVSLNRFQLIKCLLEISAYHGFMGAFDLKSVIYRFFRWRWLGGRLWGGGRSESLTGTIFFFHPKKFFLDSSNTKFQHLN